MSHDPSNLLANHGMRAAQPLHCRESTSGYMWYYHVQAGALRQAQRYVGVERIYCSYVRVADDKSRFFSDFVQGAKSVTTFEWPGQWTSIACMHGHMETRLHDNFSLSEFEPSCTLHEICLE